MRYLEYLGVDPIELMASGDGHLGQPIEVRLEAAPGDHYLLLASWEEHYAQVSGLGTLCLDPSSTMRVAQGVVPPEGSVVLSYDIPNDALLDGAQLHFQAVTGPQLLPGVAHLTNRDIVTVVE